MTWSKFFLLFLGKVLYKQKNAQKQNVERILLCLINESHPFCSHPSNQETFLPYKRLCRTIGSPKKGGFITTPTGKKKKDSFFLDQKDKRLPKKNTTSSLPSRKNKKPFPPQQEKKTKKAPQTRSDSSTALFFLIVFFVFKRSFKVSETCFWEAVAVYSFSDYTMHPLPFLKKTKGQEGHAVEIRLNRYSKRHTPRNIPRVQDAFKDLMIH